MSNSKDMNNDASKFVNDVMADKNADANDVLEKIVKTKVAKHIRKTLSAADGK